MSDCVTSYSLCCSISVICRNCLISNTVGYLMEFGSFWKLISYLFKVLVQNWIWLCISLLLDTSGKLNLRYRTGHHFIMIVVLLCSVWFCSAKISNLFWWWWFLYSVKGSVYSRDHIRSAVIFLPFHLLKLAITSPWKERKKKWTWHIWRCCRYTVKWHLPIKELVQIHYSPISLLKLLVISYSKCSI